MPTSLVLSTSLQTINCPVAYVYWRQRILTIFSCGVIVITRKDNIDSAKANSSIKIRGYIPDLSERERERKIIIVLSMNR